MAESKTVKVQDVKVETMTRKDGTGTFEAMQIVSDSGDIFSGYVNKDTTVPTVGETLTINYASVIGKKGTFNKIISLGSESKTPFKSLLKRQKVQGTSTSSSSTTSTTKDISMEVSGLLQAIITKHGLSDTTETLLRDALRIKRTVATELETTGKV